MLYGLKYNEKLKVHNHHFTSFDLDLSFRTTRFKQWFEKNLVQKNQVYWHTQYKQLFYIQTSKSLRLICHASFEFQTSNYITCFGSSATILTAKRTIHKNT